MSAPLKQQKAIVDSGQWLMYRYHPDRLAQGENPLILDSKPPKIAVKDFLNSETRFKMLTLIKPAMAAELFEQAQVDVETRYKYYQYLAERKFGE
jgi:pyruvate-ferredoxin/flavodoxin oxidoreductase